MNSASETGGSKMFAFERKHIHKEATHYVDPGYDAGQIYRYMRITFSIRHNLTKLRQSE